MNNSKNVVITVVVCVSILLAWQYINHLRQPPAPPPGKTKPVAKGKPAQKQQPGPTSKSADQPAGKPAGKRPPAAEAKGPRSATVEGKHVRLSGHGAKASFTTSGGALRHWVLLHPRYKHKRKGKLEQVDLVATEKGRGPWPLTTVLFTDEGDRDGIDLPANAEFKVSKQTSRSVHYQYRDERSEVTKEYRLDAKQSLIHFTLRVKNLTDQELSQSLRLNLFNWQDPTVAKAGMTNPYPRIPTVACHDGAEVHRRSLTSIRGEDSSCSAAGCGMGSGDFMSNTGQVLWIGSGDRYFLTAVLPLDSTKGKKCELTQLEGKDNVVQSALYYPKFRIPAAKEHLFKFTVYVGDKELGALDQVKGVNKGGDVELNSSIDYGWFFPLCRPMLWLLKKFYSVFGNWGIAIILLTLVVKLLTLYWTQKSMRSMKKMQHLKPQIDVLREKYGDDKSRLNQEMMGLYKVHKVNPLGGCLPMLIQMPIWFALYRTLGNTVELYRSPFIASIPVPFKGWMPWIADLTAPDPYYILPVLMGAAMYGQQAISPQPMEGAQAKMMKYFMPGFFTFMMLFLPSGLTLYIFVNTLLAMLHQVYMNKTDPDKKLAEAAAAAKLELASGNSGGGGKPRARRSKATQDQAAEPEKRERKGKPKSRRRARKKKKQ